MKQMLLRVPDELHRRLTERAAREGRSLNALATEVLAVAASTATGSRQERLHLRAGALGLLPDPSEPTTTITAGAELTAAMAALQGIDPVLDDVLTDLRDPR